MTEFAQRPAAGVGDAPLRTLSAFHLR